MPDWSRLRSHVPLAPGAEEYVPRLCNGGDGIARHVMVDRPNVVLMAGPEGIGKSTEIARATAFLAPERPAFLVQVDRHENMGSLTVETLERRIALTVGEQASARGANLSGELREMLAALAEPVDAGDSGNIVLRVVREVARAFQGRPVLLVDGLDKLLGERDDRLAALAPLTADADLVVVASEHVVLGAREIITPNESRSLISSVLEVEADFFRKLLERRIGPVTDAFVEDVVTPAALQSEGNPRTYLQIIAGAAAIARFDRGADWPTRRDVDFAVQARTDSFRQLSLAELMQAEARSKSPLYQMVRQLARVRKGALRTLVDGAGLRPESAPTGDCAVITDLTRALSMALHRDPGGLAIVWYPEHAMLGWLIEQIESLRPPGRQCLRVASFAEAFAAPDELVIVVPTNERQVVFDFDDNRERILERHRTCPIVLMLLRDGSGQRALLDAPGLMSWVRGRDPDLEFKAQQRLFGETTGLEPEEWQGTIPGVATNEELLNRLLGLPVDE